MKYGRCLGKSKRVKVNPSGPKVVPNGPSVSKWVYGAKVGLWCQSGPMVPKWA